MLCFVNCFKSIKAFIRRKHKRSYLNGSELGVNAQDYKEEEEADGEEVWVGHLYQGLRVHHECQARTCHQMLSQRKERAQMC